MNYHMLYTDKNGYFHNETKEFNSFTDAEIWLKSIEAIYWEIGINDKL